MKKSKFKIQGLISLLLFAAVFVSVIFIPLQTVKVEQISIHGKISNTAYEAVAPAGTGRYDSLKDKLSDAEYEIEISVFDMLLNSVKAAKFISYMESENKADKEIDENDIKTLENPEKYLSGVTVKTVDTVYFISALLPGFVRAGGEVDNRELMKSVLTLILLFAAVIFTVIMAVRFFVVVIRSALKKNDEKEFYKYSVTRSGRVMGAAFIALLLISHMSALIGDITYGPGTVIALSAGGLYVAAAYLTLNEKGYSSAGKNYMKLALTENTAQYVFASAAYMLIFKITERIKHLHWDDDQTRAKLTNLLENDTAKFYIIYSVCAALLMLVGALFISSVSHISFTASSVDELKSKNKYDQEFYLSYVTKPAYPIAVTVIYAGAIITLRYYGMLSVSPALIAVCGVLYLLITAMTAAFAVLAKKKAPGIDPAHYDLLFEKQTEEEISK